MSDLFSEILGLPPGERPPDHYELLGLERFESSAADIRGGGLKRTKELRAWQNHPDPKTAEAVQGMLTMVSQACVTLKDPRRKSVYDQRLAARLNVELSPERAAAEDEDVGAPPPVEAAAATCPVCSHENPFDAAECANCGTRLLRDCPECSAASSVLAQRCPECGTDMEAFQTAIDTLERMRQHVERRYWQNVRAERASLPADLQFPGENGGGLLDAIDALDAEALANSESVGTLKSELDEAIANGETEHAREVYEKYQRLVPNSVKMKSLADRIGLIDSRRKLAEDRDRKLREEMEKRDELEKALPQEPSSPPSRVRHVALWILLGSVVLIFIAAVAILVALSLSTSKSSPSPSRPVTENSAAPTAAVETSSTQDVAKATAMVRDGAPDQVKKGLATLTSLAGGGDPQATLALGELHADGAGVPQNNQLALDYFITAHQLGSRKAWDGIQTLYEPIKGDVVASTTSPDEIRAQLASRGWIQVDGEGYPVALHEAERKQFLSELRDAGGERDCRALYERCNRLRGVHQNLSTANVDEDLKAYDACKTLLKSKASDGLGLLPKLAKIHGQLVGNSHGNAFVKQVASEIYLEVHDKCRSRLDELRSLESELTSNIKSLIQDYEYYPDNYVKSLKVSKSSSQVSSGSFRDASSKFSEIAQGIGGTSSYASSNTASDGYYYVRVDGGDEQMMSQYSLDFYKRKHKAYVDLQKAVVKEKKRLVKIKREINEIKRRYAAFAKDPD